MDDANDSMMIQTTLPMAQGFNLTQQEVIFKIPLDTPGMASEDAATIVHQVMQKSHNSVAHIVSQRRSLKRRRTDEDLQQDHRRANEDVDFIFAGRASRTHLRMKRGRPLAQALERFAEQTGRNFASLKLFYQERYISVNSTPDDIGLEPGDELHVYERME